jgi:hypothetical protein
MRGRRIILLLDGTWNDADLGATDTNISRLRDLLARPGTSAAADSSATVTSTASDDDRTSNLVYYSRGVGTGGQINQIAGGILGVGLEANIRRAYRFISFHYVPGDQIFIFGFSRGSYTARSLVGYIAAAGLLRADKCTEENERCAWDFYRTTPGERPPGEWHRLRAFVQDRDSLRIECLAVFDTVGAMGIPLSRFTRSNRENFEFHDVELPSITNVNLHALAIDEHRWPFQASVWRPSRFKKINTITEQVWFSGAHGDIGGGYFRSNGDGASPQRADDITLDWLLRRVRTHFKDFPVADSWITGADASNWSSSRIHESRMGIYWFYPKAWRAIANRESSQRKGYEVSVGSDRHSVPLNEMIHISAIERLWTANGKPKSRYAPKNLIELLPRVEATYNDASTREPLFIVNWTGDVLDPAHPLHRDCAIAALKNAKVRASPP